MTLTPRRTGTLLTMTAMLFVASAAPAAMVPLLDLRQMHAKAVYHGVTREQNAYTGNFATWDYYVSATANDPDPEVGGFADAGAYQNSQLYRDVNGEPDGFFHAGGCSGSWQIDPGTYEALSLSTMTFRLTTTSDFFIDATYEVGEPGSEGEITLGNPNGAPNLLEVLSGHVMLNGRLGPGDYFIEGRSQVSTNGESVGGGVYAIFMTIQPTTSPFIQLQPSNIVIPPGGSGSLRATIGPPAPGTAQEGTAAFTFQWRKNKLPLTNGGHYSGATTNELTISNAAVADTGWYDLLVTSGSITEPSRYVRVAVGVTGVEPTGPAAAIDFRLDPAAPNPSSATTTFRFAAKQPVTADAAVYDASGRRVRGLSSGLLAGSGSLSWDGRAANGEAAPAGVYFLRVHVEGQTLVRRFVRMRS